MKLILLPILIISTSLMAQESINIVESSISDLEYRAPSQEEKQSLDFEYQGGLELMFWLSELQADNPNSDLTLQALQDAFDSLNSISEYPIAEYNSVWQATFGLAVVFAEQIKYDLEWEWIMLENSPKIDVGWCLVSKDYNYGINVEQIFYRNIMIKKPIELLELYNKIKQLTIKGSASEGKIKFFTLN